MRGERQSERSAQPAATADRNFSAFWLITKQQHTIASNVSSYTLSDLQLNGIAFGMN